MNNHDLKNSDLREGGKRPPVPGALGRPALHLAGCRGARRRPSWGQSVLVAAALLAIAFAVAPAPSPAASISVGISVGVAPPPIPVYTQPPCPAPGYMWTPGYWAYDPERGYFWVPGTWVMAPAPGMLWTPGYWGWGGAAFIFHAGYWGPHIGFYGGINYGFGYPGVGFVGGEWRGHDFFYNRAVNNFAGVHVTNVYYRPVANNFAVNRVSYNGGRGGISARPTPGELAAAHDRHIEATSLQRQHETTAHNERGQFASFNHGHPGVAATGRAGEFHGGTVRASAGANPGPNHSVNAGHGPSGNNHQVMTAHQNAPAMRSYGGHSGGPGSGPANHGAPSGGASHPPESHQHTPEPHNSRPSGGGHGNEHAPESRH